MSENERVLSTKEALTILAGEAALNTIDGSLRQDARTREEPGVSLETIDETLAMMLRAGKIEAFLIEGESEMRFRIPTQRKEADGSE